MKITFALLAIVLTGCSGVRMGVYHDFSGRTVGGDQVFMLEVPFYKGKKHSCEYRHESKIFYGEPFNDKPESTFDLVGCSYEFE